MSPDDTDRRPLASRQTGWARSITRWLVAKGVSPDAISIASMAFAAVAAASAIAASASAGNARALLLLLVAVACQARLLCNLFDGMVAMAGGRHSPGGAFWNEWPDRASDLLILAGIGVAAHTPAWGWAAAACALLTAYGRELGHRLTGQADYSGWMAKPQRMATVTVGCLGASLAVFLQRDALADTLLLAALAVVTVGSVGVAITRARRTLVMLHDPDARR